MTEAGNDPEVAALADGDSFEALVADLMECLVGWPTYAIWTRRLAALRVAPATGRRETATDFVHQPLSHHGNWNANGHSHLWFCQCSDPSIPRHDCAAPATGLPAAEGLRDALRRRHAEVCACPFDGSDPGCNLLMDGAELAALAAADRAAGLPLGVERLATAIVAAVRAERAPIGYKGDGWPAYWEKDRPATVLAVSSLAVRLAAEYARLAADPQSPTGGEDG